MPSAEAFLELSPSLAVSEISPGAQQLYLPATEQFPDSTSEAPEPPTETLASSLRVMLVEDERMVRELTKRILIGALHRRRADLGLAAARGAAGRLAASAVFQPAQWSDQIAISGGTPKRTPTMLVPTPVVTNRCRPCSTMCPETKR